MKQNLLSSKTDELCSNSSDLWHEVDCVCYVAFHLNDTKLFVCRRNSFQLLLVVLRNVLMQFKTFLPESFGLLIESNNFDDQLFLMLCEYLTTADCNCRLTKLLPTWQFHLKDCLSYILQLRSIEDHWNNIFVLGQAWISIGLLQAHCLMPRGPVDPCHYLTTRMKYARADVSCNTITRTHFFKCF